MKIELRQPGYQISCKHCFVNFSGHAICNHCADGYLLRDIETDGEKGLARLVRVFHLTETRTTRNRRRIKTEDPNAEAETVLTFSIVTTYQEVSVNDEAFIRTSTHRVYSIDEIQCSACRSGHLIFVFPDNSKCPSCGWFGLSRVADVIFN